MSPATRRTPISPQRTAAVALIVVQAAALVLMMREPVFAICAAAIAIAGWRAPPERMLQNFDARRGALLIVILFTLKFAFAPVRFPFELRFIETEAAFEIACACLVLQLFALFLKQYQQRLPVWFLIVSAAGFIVSYDVRADAVGRHVAMGLVVLYFPIWGMYASASRIVAQNDHPRPSFFRLGVLSGVLASAMLSGAIVANLIYRHENKLERMVSEYVSLLQPRVARAGFSGLGGLSDVSRWQRNQSDLIALRISAPTRPDYLRGRAFTFFDDNRWEVAHEYRHVSPALTVPPEIHVRRGDHLFPLEWPLPDDVSPIEVWPIDLETAGHCFVPLETVAVACASDIVQTDNCNTVQRPEGDAASYLCLLAPPSHFQTEEADIEFLQVPESIDPRVKQLSRDLCGGLNSGREKMDAVSEYFRNHFRYEWGIRAPPGEDRLAYFLFERKKAHCEYFATATTLLLRLAGVPARYVTGFVVSERSPVDGRWIARRDDSHAWVEAFDEELGRWVTVESTPIAGIPGPGQRTLSHQLRESFFFQFLRLQESLKTGSILSLFWTGLLLLLGLLAALIILGTAGPILRRRWRNLRWPTRMEPAMGRLLQERMKMDQFLARRGIRRAPEETVVRFAARLDRHAPPVPPGVADWYRRYATLRFRDEPLDDEVWEGIHQQRRELTQGKSR